MQFYASPSDEAVALRRAAARAACAVRSLAIQPTTLGAPPRVVSALSCADGWAAARLLLALAIEDARTPGARSLAEELRASTSTDEEFAEAIRGYVREHVKFEPERDEEFESGGYTLARGAGDCDAHFRLVYAIATAGGLRSALAILHHGSDVPREDRGPAHALAVLELGGKWTWCETMVDARMGENPNDAAARLGLTNDRSDIAREVEIMTEESLPPLPPGFREKNKPAQVLLDSEALQRLGYLAADVPACVLSDPTAAVLRSAVARFQRARGIVVDGQLGPTTRLTIARALHEAGPPVTEGFDYPGMAGLGGAAPSTSKTQHLSPGFFAGVRAMADRFRAKGARIGARDLLLVWLAESGIRNIPNRLGAPFGGLNQMGPDERRAAGFIGTFADWLAMSCEAQLPFVERYYVNATGGNFSRYIDAQALYLANFAPAHMAHADDPDHILFRRDPNGPQPNAPAAEWEAWRQAHKSDPYAWNLGLDVTKDGTIRVGELGAVLTAAERSSGAYFGEVLARLGAEEPVPRGSAATAVAVVVGSGIAAAGAAAVWWFT
jgi:hypothetical protein